MCLEQAEIVRANLAAIGIDLEIRRFSFGTMYARIAKPDEPFDLSLFGWVGDTPDPSQFIDVMFSLVRGHAFLDRTPLGAADARREPARRRRADRGLRRAGPRHRGAGGAVRAVISAVRTDFFSARIGCQVEHPLYGIDLAALCVRE